MTSQYILLILLSLLPIAYKISFWSEIFRSDTTLYFKLKKWFSHFWFYIEFPLFFFSLTIFIEPLFEIFLYGFFFYFFILYNVFVWGKIFRKKLPHARSFFQLIIPLIWLFSLYIWFAMYLPKFLYLNLIGMFFIIPLFFIIQSLLFSKKLS